MIVIVLLVVLASNLQAQDVVIQRHFKGDIYTSSKLIIFISSPVYQIISSIPYVYPH